MLGEVLAERRPAEVEDDVVQRALAGRGEILHPLEVVLLRGEAALAPERAAQRGSRRRDKASEGPLSSIDARVSCSAARLSPAAVETPPRAAEATPLSGLAVRALASRALAAGADRPEPGHVAPVGVGRERAEDQAHPADAVDQRVVDLHVDREAVALEPLDQVNLPEGPVQVELVAVQAGDEDAELALSARVRQGRVADVVVEVDVALLAHERRLRAQERGLRQAQVPWRRDALGVPHAVELLLQVVV